MTALRKLFLLLRVVICGAGDARAADDKTLELAKKEGQVNF